MATEPQPKWTVPQLMDQAHIRAGRAEAEANSEWCPRFQAVGMTWCMQFHHYFTAMLIKHTHAKSAIDVCVRWDFIYTMGIQRLRGTLTGQFPGCVACTLNRSLRADEEFTQREFILELARLSAEMLEIAAAAVSVGD